MFDYKSDCEKYIKGNTTFNNKNLIKLGFSATEFEF